MLFAVYCMWYKQSFKLKYLVGGEEGREIMVVRLLKSDKATPDVINHPARAVPVLFPFQ